MSGPTISQDDPMRLLCSEHFNDAYARVRPHISKTRCIKSERLSAEAGGDVFLKLENEQITGSFKIRGVTNKILSLGETARAKLLIAASSGNHGAAFAHTVTKLGLRGELFTAENIAAVKREALEGFGVPITFVGTDCVEAEVAARAHSERVAGTLVGPYNDIDVILGQGTIGIELMDQLGTFDVLFVPVGGGGLISGIAAYLKSIGSETKIVGCQPEHSPVMLESIRAGRIVEMESLPTLADATAGGIEPGAITLELCRELVDDFVVLSEKEIVEALKVLHLEEGIVAEGGSAMTVAAVRKRTDLVKGKRAALVISGGKIDAAIIEQLGSKDD